MANKNPVLEQRLSAFEHPNLVHIRQHFERPVVRNIEETVKEELNHSGVSMPQGGRIAIAAGSRGIANLTEIVRTVCSWVRAQGAEPFLVPAMGSHGGATGAGQQRILEDYGLTQSYTGAPIKASMEVVELESGNLPVPVYFDRYAHEADGVIIINRIKPHTDFHGTYESGLMKIMVIGLGKHKQALAIHKYGVRGLRDFIPQVARVVLQQGKVLLGIGIVENAYDETQTIKAIPAPQIPDQEPKLLELARASMPSFPVDKFDILVLDRFGKDISGAGLDPNIIGRWMIYSETEPERPDIKLIILGDLTPASHGNAVGLGLADIMVRRAYDKVNWDYTYENLYTSSFLYRGRTPVVVNSDKEALMYAMRGSNVIDPANARIIRIQDTLHLSDLLVSPAVLAEVEGQSNIEVLGSPGDVFAEDGAYQYQF